MESVIFIEHDRIKPVPGAKVIKASDYTKIHKAEEILKESGKRAKEILNEAKAQFNVEVNSGYEEGLIIANKEMAKKLIELSIRIDHFHKELEEQSVILVMDVVKKILKGIQPEELIVGQVKKALEVMKTQQSVIIKVHPSNVQILNDKLSDIISGYPVINTIEIKSDQHLSDTDLTIESPAGILDAGINIQLKAIEDVFSDILKSEK